MNVKNLRKKDMKILNDKITELYNKKFQWADDNLIESMINTHVKKVVHEMNEEDYLKEIAEEEE